MHVCIAQYAGIDAIAGLPLAAGLLVATARRDPELADARYTLRVRRQPLPEAVERLDAPDVQGFSLYPWNLAYSLAVAAEARAVWPEALFVAGGPAVPRDRDSARAFLAAHPAIDVLVFSEGELSFRALLRAVRAGRSLGEVGGIAYREDGAARFTAPPERVRDFARTGSPYLDGTFDALLAEHPGRFSLALLETNRGCPFSCTFCDWSMTTKVVDVPLERIEAELAWVGRSGLPNLCFTDANFGIRRRDRGIAERVAAEKAAGGTPRFCYFYLTKNNHQRNLQTIEVLEAAGIDYCVGLAVQDFDDGVLEAVKRDNIQSGESIRLREICAERGIRSHNELILGMPRQSYDTFVTTVLRAMPGHPRHDFRIFLCRLIDNTELAEPATRERYGIESRRCLWPPAGADFDPIIDEHQEIVVATRDMPLADWRRTCRFAFFAAAAYNQRLLRHVLRYLGDAGLDRRGYLEHLVAALAGPGVYGRMGAAAERLLDAMLDGGPLSLPLEGMGPARYEMAEAMAIEALRDVDAFFAETRGLTEAFLGEPLAGALDEALRFQELCTPRLGQAAPRTEQFQRDWLAYSAGPAGTELLERPTAIVFRPPPTVRMADFAGFAATHLACLLAATGTGELGYGAPALARS